MEKTTYEIPSICIIETENLLDGEITWDGKASGYDPNTARKLAFIDDEEKMDEEDQMNLNIRWHSIWDDEEE